MSKEDKEKFENLMRGIRAGDEAVTYIKDAMMPLIWGIYESAMQQGFNEQQSFTFAFHYWDHLIKRINQKDD